METAIVKRLKSGSINAKATERTSWQRSNIDPDLSGQGTYSGRNIQDTKKVGLFRDHISAADYIHLHSLDEDTVSVKHAAQLRHTF